MKEVIMKETFKYKMVVIDQCIDEIATLRVDKNNLVGIDAAIEALTNFKRRIENPIV